MRRPTVHLLRLLLPALLPSVILMACSQTQDAQADGEQASTTEAGAAAIPITTSSEEARDLYIKGRDLSEKLRGPDARPLLEQAVQKDPPLLPPTSCWPPRPRPTRGCSRTWRRRSPTWRAPPRGSGS